MLDIVRRYSVGQKAKKILLLLASVVVLCAVIIVANTQAQKRKLAVSMDFIMDTVIEQKLYGKNGQQAVDEISRRLREYEQMCSMYLEESQVSQINQNAGKEYIEVSDQCLELIERSKQYAGQSNGLFDITIAPLTTLWGITSDHPKVPSQQEIDKAKALVNYQDILIDGNKVMLRREGQAIDLGAVAKGAACEIVREVAQQYEITSGYVSIGGNLIVLGEKPDGSAYRFGIRDPQGEESEYLGTISLEGKTMATTGTYERWFEQDGVRYHHVIDPRTGYPADSDLLSVSVISEDGLLADCMSTALFIEGKEAALAKMQEEEYQLVIVDQEGTVYCSPSLKGNFEPNTENKHSYTYQYAS